MPKSRRKRFIDPKKSVTFEIVPRNQVDPLAADESAPKNVLVEKRTRRVIETEHEHQELPPEKRQEEQHKYGIYFDDDYNYLQHLRDVRVVGEMKQRVFRIDLEGAQVEIECDTDDEDGEAGPSNSAPIAKASVGSGARPGRLVLPSSVFASHVEERVGHLNKGLTHTGPQPDWDPDVIAALDDDFEGENEGGLEDDFVALASGGAHCIEDLGAGDEEITTRRQFYFAEKHGLGRMDEDDDDDDMFSSDFDEEEDQDHVGEMPRRNFGKEETRSRFTDYSLSSSVMTRTGGLKTLDDEFEQLFEREYDEADVGALDGEEIEGRLPVESKVVNKLAEQYEQSVRLSKGAVEEAIGAPDNTVKKQVLKAAAKDANRKNVEMEEIAMIDNEPDDEQRWDCESILSTYSNLHNRPKVIDIPSKKIQLGVRGMPSLNDGQPGLTKRALKELESDYVKAEDYARSVCSRASAVSVARQKGETAEERKARKLQVKEFRRERRFERKANSMAFKAEECRQKVQDMNVRNNLQGIKLL